MIYVVSSDTKGYLEAADCKYGRHSVAFIEFGPLSLYTADDTNSVSNAWEVPVAIRSGSTDYDHKIISASVSASDSHTLDFTSSRRKRRATTTSDTTTARLNIYHSTTEQAEDLFDWMNEDQYPLPNGMTSENVYWYGVEWDMNVRRYRIKGQAILDAYAYVDEQFPFELASDFSRALSDGSGYETGTFIGATWDSSKHEYELTDTSQLCVQLVLRADTSPQVWLRTADCSGSAMTMVS